MENGFQQCAEAYAAEVGKTAQELQAENIWPVRCRCRPGTDNPHCGGFYMVQSSMEKVDYGDGGAAEVGMETPLTSAHGVAA